MIQPVHTKTAGPLKSMVRGKLTLLFRDRLLDCLTILLLAVGLSLGFSAITVLEASVRLFAGLAALSLALIVLLGSHWWLTPSLLLFGAAGFAAWRFLQGDLSEWVAYFRDFFLWAWQGAPYHKTYTQNGSLLVLQAALVFVATLAAYLLIRRLYSFPLTFCLTTGSFAFIHILGGTELSIAACITATGMILLLPRVYAGYLERNGSGLESRATLQGMALPIAILALLLSLWIVPDNTSPWKSRGLNNFFNDLGQLFDGPFQGIAPNSSNFRLSGLGLQPEERHLGGPVTLTDETFLTVSAEQPVLLRGAVLDRYDGRSWSIGGADGDLRYGSLFWRQYQREAFDRDKPAGGPEARELYGKLTKNVSLIVTYQSNRYTTLFAGGRVDSARFLDGRLDEPPYFNLRSELYLHLRIPQRTRLEVNTRIWTFSSPSFDEDFSKLEVLLQKQSDELYERLRERYTAIPDSLPAEVETLVREITEGMESPYRKARAIERWLTEHCAYTLDPATPPEADFVAHFLETREGYCTYFASAMAVMARCAGLPSRYVTGFALEQSPAGDSYLATGKTAHAWAEIYFQGIGWIEFDPLRWDVSHPLNADASTVGEPPEADPRSSGEEILPSDMEAAGPGEASEQGPVNWLPLLIGVAAGLLLLCAVRVSLRAIMDSKFRVYEWARVSRKIADLSDRLEYYYTDIIRQLELLQMGALPGETLLTYPIRVDRRFRFEDSTFEEVAFARMHLHFAEEAPSAEDVEIACFLHENLEYTLLETLGVFPYFFRRAARFRTRR